MTTDGLSKRSQDPRDFVGKRYDAAKVRLIMGGGLSTCNSVWDNVNEISHRANTQSGHEKCAARYCLMLDVATVRLSSATDKKNCVEIKETKIRGTESTELHLASDRRFEELLK